MPKPSPRVPLYTDVRKITNQNVKVARAHFIILLLFPLFKYSGRKVMLRSVRRPYKTRGGEKKYKKNILINNIIMLVLK